MTPPSAASTPPAPASIDQSAALLARARRVLVTGLVGATADATRAACDVAEALGAAIDFGQPDLARPAGPTIARAGEITATIEDMHDRADLVILWGCDPATTHPAIAATIPPTAAILRLPLDRTDAVDAARLIQFILQGGSPPVDGGSLTDACIAAHAAIEKASCVAIVTDDAADPLGLEAWSVVHLVRAISHVKPAFEIPLRAADHAAAAAVCTWRYGAAGAIACADRSGGRFLPAEASARQLIDRGEVDCVLAVGRVPEDVDREIAARGAGLVVIRLGAEPGALQELRRAVAGQTQGGRA